MVSDSAGQKKKNGGHNIANPEKIPVTTHENFTLQFSDTAFDLSVVSKEGCVSSVSWAITLHSVLLYQRQKEIQSFNNLNMAETAD